MKNWEDDDDSEFCSTRQDLIDVASVCDVIGVDLEVVNFSAEYKDRVFAEFLREYQAGRTPNPDVLCNAEIKFKAFLDHAMGLGAERIATGHYAQVREFQGKMQLLKGEDGTKDQSYFLHRLNQAQLQNTMFPVGHIYKRDLRKIAEDAKLPNFAKKDSTGICFIGERPFREFLQRYLPTQPGEIRNLDTDKRHGPASGPDVSHHRPARRSRHWWRQGRAGAALVCGAEGHGEECALCGAGARPSGAAQAQPQGAGSRPGFRASRRIPTGCTTPRRATASRMRRAKSSVWTTRSARLCSP